MEDLFKKTNVIKDDHMVFVEGKKSETCNIPLHLTFSNGWEVKIVKKTETIHDFALSGSA